MSEDTSTGRVLYFDPNNKYISNDNTVGNILDGLQLTKDLEDFSIAVDLEITTKTRSTVKTNDGGSISISNPQTSTNFLKGSNLGGENVLSTYFTDIKFDENDTKFQNESLSINSIDIEFTSWYVASVIIKFTDVRGSALFSPSEYDYNNSGVGDISNGNLFAGFFTMPYPIFNLKIKGFYGDSVTYPLHLQDFKAEFNSENGNFDVTAQFIGYTYAMLSDIRVPYLISAPYLEMYGAAYWDSQVSNGRFKTYEGDNLPKIPELLKKIIKGQKFEKNINSSNEFSKELESLIVKSVNIKDLNNLINIYENIINNAKEKENKIISEQKNNIIKKINSYKNTYPDDNIFEKFNEAYFSVKDGKVELSEIKNSIKIFLDNLNNKISDLQKEIDSTIKNTITEVYGIIPSIYNFNKILLAHMETLIHVISECAENIKKEDRRISSEKVSTDLKDDKLSPFPWITYDNKDEWIGNFNPDFLEVQLVKSFLKTYDEVNKDVEKIISTISTNSVIPTEQSDSENENAVTKNIWLPINGFDNAINIIGGKEKKPYSNMVEMKENLLNELKALLSTRITTIIGLSSENSSTDESYVLAEFKNITNELGYNADIINAVITSLNDIMKYKNTTDNKILRYTPLREYLTNNKVKKSYEYNFLDTKGILPLTDDSIKYFNDNYTFGTGVISGLKNFKFYKSSHLLGQNIKQRDLKDTNTTIVSGSDNCENIYKDWYLNIDNIIKESPDLKNIVKNIKISKEESSNSFNKKLNPLQPIMNTICYVKPIEKEGNANSIRKLMEESGYVKKGVKLLEVNKNNQQNINNFIFSEENKNFNKLYKLYSGKDNIQDANKDTDFLKQKDIFVSGNTENKLTYPMVGGNFGLINVKTSTDKGDYVDTYKKNEIPTCLFGNGFYYAQNNYKDTNYANKIKAYLFLQTLPISITSLTNNLINNKKSFMIRMPKSEMLLLGSMLWRKKNKINFNETENFQIPNYDEYFRVNKIFHIQEVPINNNTKINQVNFDKCEILSKINEPMSEEFISFFEKWCNNKDKNSVDNWYKIWNNLELKTVSNYLFLIDGFKNLKAYFTQNNNYKSLFNKINKIAEENYSIIEINNKANNRYYSTLGLIHKDGSPGVKAILNLLFNECIVTYTGDINLMSFKPNNLEIITDSELNGVRVDNFIKSLIVKLQSYRTNLTKTSDKLNQDINVAYENYNSTAIIDNDSINLQVYKYLKTLYDKWVCGYNFNTNESEYKWISTEKSKLNNIETFNIKNFKFIDRSYNDIGTNFIIDYNKIFDSLTSSNENKNLYSVITEVMAANNFLFIPMPNYQSWDNIDDFKKVFEPIPYVKSNINNKTNSLPIFLCMYTGEPSKSLNISTVDNEFKDDTFNFNDNQSIPADFNSNIDSEVMNKVPAFSVSYGKQNQSYFKKITLNQNNPITTEASIMSVKNLLSSNDNKSSSVSLSQDLYSVYSRYSYTCQVEMMGCAQIQPMMYFQLTNIPMWNGAYLIYKVNHSIRPGHMTTNFTGMRMSNRYPKLVKPEIISSGNLSDGNQIIAGKNSNISNINRDTLIGKYFKLGEYTVNENTIYDWVVDRLKNNVAPTIDSIYETWNISDKNKNYGKFKITSGYRGVELNKKVGGVSDSQHLESLAIDIQLSNPSKEGNDALFEHIKERMRRGLKIDQLIKEPSNKGGWVHVSPISIKDGKAGVRGEYIVLDSNFNTIPSLTGVIENAKGFSTVLNKSSELNKFLEYWKNAENNKGNKNSGWNKDVKLWYAHDSVEGGQKTIAYGIKLIINSLLSNGMKSINFNNLYDGNIGITDEVAINEIIAKIEKSKQEVKRIYDKNIGQGKYDNLKERYKYAMIDIHLNTGNLNEFQKFMIAISKDNLPDVIRESKRYSNVKELSERNYLFENYLKS